MLKTVVDILCCIALAAAAVLNIWAAIELHEYSLFLDGELKRMRGKDGKN